MAFSTLFLDSASGGTLGGIKDMVSDLSQTIGVDLFEEDIDNVVFQTNEFLCNQDFIGSTVPSGGSCRSAWLWAHSSVSS